ncbi:hypothetical protein ANO11243_071030 [Dothideomycetidae sp. 11243]|nr:hypothetical protein ANO11243_071030 [fungal sp. No.11243]
MMALARSLVAGILLLLLASATEARHGKLRAESSSCARMEPYTSELAKLSTHPVDFCRYYLSATRSRSPFNAISASKLSAACTCLMKHDGIALPHHHDPGTAAATHPPRICKPKYKTIISKSFHEPKAFCKFFDAFPRTLSPVPDISPDNLLDGCKCFETVPTQSVAAPTAATQTDGSATIEPTTLATDESSSPSDAATSSDLSTTMSMTNTLEQYGVDDEETGYYSLSFSKYMQVGNYISSIGAVQSYTPGTNVTSVLTSCVAWLENSWGYGSPVDIDIFYNDTDTSWYCTTWGGGVDTNLTDYSYVPDIQCSFFYTLTGYS